MENEQKKKSGAMESIAITRVPKEDRRSWVAVMLVQMGCMICIPALMTGALMIKAMPLSHMIIADIVGTLIIGALISLTGFIGADLGVPSVIVSKAAFGAQGARIFISLIWAVTAVGWFAIQCEECSISFVNLLENNFGINMPVIVSIVLWGVIMLLTAVFGFGAMEKLNAIAIPLLVLSSIIGVVMAIKDFGTTGMTDHYVDPTNEMSIIEGVTLVVSFAAFGAAAAPDFTRYQKNRKQTVISNCVGYALVGFLMILLGALLTLFASDYDISNVFITVGLPLVGITALMLATWTTNTSNVYSAGLDLVSLLQAKDDKRGLLTAIAGVIAIIVTVMGIASDMVSTLDVLGCLTLPATGALMGDYYLVRKGNPKNWKYIKDWRISGFAATAVGIATTYIPVGIGMINGLVVAGLAMWLFETAENKIRNLKEKEFRIEFTDEDIDEYYA